MALIDFKNPYDYPLCDSKYVGEEVIDGERHKARAYWIDFAKYFGNI